MQCFKKELDFLKSDKKDKIIPSLVNDLNLFIDGFGILRCKGRLSKLNYYDISVTEPILIGKNSHFTRLLIENQHRLAKHQGVGTCLSLLRQNGYWCPQGRQTVKSVLSTCLVCKKMNISHFRYPKVNALPEFRVNYEECRAFKMTDIYRLYWAFIRLRWGSS